MKKPFKAVGLVLLFLALSLFLLLSPFLSAHITGRVQNTRIKKEVFSYVLENRDRLAKTAPAGDILYTTAGFGDAGVEYGFFYSPGGQYELAGEASGSGRLQYGRPNSGGDWRYQEPICDDWIYYEEHFG